MTEENAGFQSPRASASDSDDDHRPLCVYLHRVNTLVRLRQMREELPDEAGIQLLGRAIRWGVETDVQWSDGQLVTSHGNSMSNASSLGEFLHKLQDQDASWPLILELKESVDTAVAIDELAALRDSIDFQTSLIASFNPRLLKRVRSVLPEFQVGLMTWGPYDASWMGLLERIWRAMGRGGAAIPREFQADVLLTPWRIASSHRQLRHIGPPGRVIAGSVDSANALEALRAPSSHSSHSSHSIEGILTDHWQRLLT